MIRYPFPQIITASVGSEAFLILDDHELDAQAEREAMVMLQADDYN